jgi:hypothetical protein
MVKLTIGRFVIYKVHAMDAMEIQHNSAKELPAIVVAARSDTLANLQIFTDGPARHTPMWKTNVSEGTVPGTWHWPERV